MTNTDTASSQSHRAHLRAIAVKAMRDRGLDPEFPPDALAEVAALTAPAQTTEEPTRDLRALLWCSIDNDDSRDLDQLSVAQSLANGQVRVLVAVADVDALVTKASAIDGHASGNTTSVYTAAQIFPMLPERLSTDLTSLGESVERLALIVDMTGADDGTVVAGDVYRATVVNK